MTRHLPYTEEDVERLADVAHEACDGPTCDCTWSSREEFRASARAILAALSSSGRLVPPGGEVRRRPIPMCSAGEVVMVTDVKAWMDRQASRVADQLTWSPVPDTERTDDA